MENTGDLFAYVCCIELGNCISIDFVEAAEYYKLCAGQGDQNSQLHYGLCLELGNNWSQNPKRFTGGGSSDVGI
jgi:TPR repeat protein